MALHDPGHASPGEIGGIVAGIIAVLAAIGGGIRFLLNWLERRASTRAAKLQAWQEELVAERAALAAERADFTARMEDRLDTLEKENRAWRLAFHVVGTELRRRDPDNAHILIAEKLLAAAIPFDADIPQDMAQLLAELARAPDADSAPSLAI